MLLFKASGATYKRVVMHQVHAFRDLPLGLVGDEFVLLSKNRADCGTLEKQIQYVAKILAPRAPKKGELEHLFPDVGAQARWDWVVDLYWTKKLPAAFNLADVVGLNESRYRTVQDFATLDEADGIAVTRHLSKINPDLLIDFIAYAERPDSK